MRDVDTDIAHMVRIVEGFLSAGFADKAEKYADSAVELMDSRRRYCRAAYWGVDADVYQAEIERLAADTVDDDAATESAVQFVPLGPIEVHIVREEDEREEDEPAPPPVDTDETGEGWDTEASYVYMSREGNEITESEAREPTPPARFWSEQARRDFEANKKNEGRADTVDSTPEPTSAPVEITPSELRDDARRAASQWHWGHARKPAPEKA